VADERACGITLSIYNISHFIRQDILVKVLGSGFKPSSSRQYSWRVDLPEADKMLIRQNVWQAALFHRPAP
jgi:hypothetical protein